MKTFCINFSIESTTKKFTVKWKIQRSKINNIFLITWLLMGRFFEIFRHVLYKFWHRINDEEVHRENEKYKDQKINNIFLILLIELGNVATDGSIFWNLPTRFVQILASNQRRRSSQRKWKIQRSKINNIFLITWLLMGRFFEILRQSDNGNTVRIFTLSTELSMILGVSLKPRSSSENFSNEIPCSRSDEAFTRRYSVSSFNSSVFFNRSVIHRA